MAESKISAARIPAELEAAARKAHPELAGQPISLVLRVGLAVLAGLSVGEAITRVRGKSGTQLPDPLKDAA
jgi:hypothetical protein